MKQDVMAKVERMGLNVVFKDGTVMVFKSFESDKYEIKDGLLTVFNRNKIVGHYNIDCIEAIIPPKY